MYLYYEDFHVDSTGVNPEGDIRYFLLTSDARTPRVNFYDKNEKARFELVKSFFKQINIAYVTYDATTHMYTIIGPNGTKLLAIIEMGRNSGLLSNLQVKKIVDLEDKIQKGNLLWEPPKAKASQRVEVKFNEEDFFHKPVSQSNELSGNALYEALAALLAIDVASLKSASNDALKSIYRKAAMRLHPDRNGGDASKMSELTYLWRLFNGN